MNWKLKIVLLALLIGIASCKKDEEDAVDTSDPNATLKSQVIENYANIVLANYEDALTDAEELNTALIDFVATPNDANLSEAKEAWFNARESYGTTEAFRFYAGPIDDEDGPEGLLNAWPLDESFIDYVDGAATSGIINNTTTYPTLSKTILESLNEDQGVAENVAIGYHAIEFLLWGQDLTDPSAMLAGQRSFTDYTTLDNATRRGEYLLICGELLKDHLQLLIDEWDEGGSNYRSDFLALSNAEALKNIFTGIGVLAKSELAGERIYTAYSNRAQED